MFLILLYIPRITVAETYGNSIFKYLSNLYTVFHNDSIMLYFHKQCAKV